MTTALKFIGDSLFLRKDSLYNRLVNFNEVCLVKGKELKVVMSAQAKIYHIVHVDRLPSIIKDKCLWCDAKINKRLPSGTTIGMESIKARRRNKVLDSIDLCVGNCVPFYFCPRSVMLYLLHKGNAPGLEYKDGQDPIVHLEADLYKTVSWAKKNQRRWAFTLSNAAAYYCEYRSKLSQLVEINRPKVEVIPSWYYEKATRENV